MTLATAAAVKCQVARGSSRSVRRPITGTAPATFQAMTETVWSSRGIVLFMMVLALQASAPSRTRRSPSNAPPAVPRSISTSTTPMNAMAVPAERRTVSRSDGTKRGSRSNVKNGCTLKRMAARPAVVIVSPRLEQGLVQDERRRLGGDEPRRPSPVDQWELAPPCVGDEDDRGQQHPKRERAEHRKIAQPELDHRVRRAQDRHDEHGQPDGTRVQSADDRVAHGRLSGRAPGARLFRRATRRARRRSTLPGKADVRSPLKASTELEQGRFMAVSSDPL